MPTKKEIKKVPVRRTRKVSSGNITVSRRSNEETIHVVNLKKPFTIEPIVERPEFNLETAPGISHEANSWSFKLYRKIAITFILVALVILAVVAYFAFVKLEIVVTPKVLPVKATASFTVYDRPSDFNLPVASVLGIVREMEADYSGIYPVSGGEVIGAEVTGKVTLVNNYIKDQPLVASTRLLTASNQLLRLRDTVLVPAGGTIEANVYGDAVDPSFTLADAKLTIPGLWAGLQDKIYAEAKAGAVTYKEKRKSVVTQADLDSALASAKQALLEKAAGDIESVYGAYDQKLYELDDKTTAFSYDVKVGDEASEVKITMTSKITVVAFKKSEVANLNQTTLESGLKQGQALVENSATPATYKVVTSDVEKNIAEVELLVDGSSVAKSDTDLIDRQKLVGLNRSQIEGYLKGIENIESFELHFSPSFYEVAPQLVDRISVKIK